MNELRARLDDSDAARDDLQLRLSRSEAALRELRLQAEELAADKQVRLTNVNATCTAGATYQI